jgi:predicted transcriptional regulator
MKAILMSIRSQHLVNILNGKKTIELRKQFPSDFRGWVYCYCTLGKPYLYECALYILAKKCECAFVHNDKDETALNFLSGKVVCRFWVDKVNTYYVEGNILWLLNEKEHSVVTGYKIEQGILRKSCVSLEDFKKYAKPINDKQKRLFAIHISKLEIFDEPMELNEFYKIKYRTEFEERYIPIKQAPQSWQYIYIKEAK